MGFLGSGAGCFLAFGFQTALAFACLCCGFLVQGEEEGGAEAVQPENGEKFVPKGVFFGTLALSVLEAAGKSGGKAVFVFVGVGGHGEDGV